MKTIGLLGGMSWESSLMYYQILNEGIKRELGGLNSAKCLMYSINFAEVEVWMRQERWDKVLEVMTDAGGRLEKAGADFLVIGTNTVHLIAGDLQKNLGIPILHIAEATGRVIEQKGLKKVGILGTRFTMEKGLYHNIFETSFGIRAMIPEQTERDLIHQIIFEELCLGIITESSRDFFLNTMDGMIRSGAEGIVLACTEIPLLVNQHDVGFPVFDTTQIHAEAAVQMALAAMIRDK